MATNAVYIKNGTSFVWANSDYSPAAANSLGTYSATYDIDLTSLSAAAARQSIKADLGNPRAGLYVVDACVEIASDPAAGGTIDFYWSHSESATAATGNTGKTSGADGAYTGYDTLTLAESLVHLQFIGTLTCGVNNDVDGVQFGAVGYFMPRARYGSLVVVNNLSVALHSDAVEMGVRFIPIFDDIQAAA